MHLRLLATALTVVLSAPALADIEQVDAEGSVDDVMKRLESAVVTAGATVFAKVDHGAGAESVGTPIGASQLLVFGSPNLGTPAIIDDPLAGLVLPLRVLVYADGDGQTRIAYEEIEAMFDGLSIDDDAEYVATMERVLDGFIEAASE
jgi:uncharacterized protein (DUF302 family)